MAPARISFLFSIVLLLAACEEEEKSFDPTVDKGRSALQTSQAEGSLDYLQRKVTEVLSDNREPLEKIQHIRELVEYRTSSIPLETPAKKIEEILNILGKKGWHCFSIQRRPKLDTHEKEGEEELLLFFRRGLTYASALKTIFADQD